MLATAAAGVALLGLAARVASARADLLRARADVETARDLVVARRGPAARAALDRAAARLEAVRDGMGAWPFRLLAPVPLLGSPAEAIGDAAGAGLELVEAGRIVAAAADRFPTAGGVALDGHDLGAFHDASVRSAADLEAAGRHLARARAMLGGPAGAFLPQVSGPARSIRTLLDGAAGQVRGARAGLALLADLTAAGTDARVLVLAQDTMELRPTGGFIGSYGVLHFRRGTVRLEEYDSFESLPPPDPPLDAPAGLAHHLDRPWDLSNAGWWPDFPTSAATARELFFRQTGTRVDGVLALTEQTMARLTGALGPFHVPGYAEPIAEDGFGDRVLYEVEVKRPLDRPRKRFLIRLSRLVFDRLFSLRAADVPAVVDALDRSIAAGDVQLWFADPGRQRHLDGATVAGALPPAGGDFLMLVDANLTAGKANRDLVRDVAYRVRRDRDGRLVARLDVEVRNEGDRSPRNRYYNGTLRVYVPRGVTPAGPEHPIIAAPAEDGPYDVLTTQVYVPPHGRVTRTWEYVLPATVSEGPYRLTWVRQAGTPADTFQARLGGRTVTPDPALRTFHAEGGLGRSRWREWLHDRWIFRRLGL